MWANLDFNEPNEPIAKYFETMPGTLITVSSKHVLAHFILKATQW